MVKQFYKKSIDWIDRNRFHLLLLSTLLVLILPGFARIGVLTEVIFVTTIGFLFIQSMSTVNIKKSRRRMLRIIVIALILISWLKPLGIDSILFDILKFFSFVAFFIFIIYNLLQFIVRSTFVNMNVLIASINIYLLGGIVGASLANVFYYIYPKSYHFPAYIENPDFASFLYYGFITMSTLGYGDILPAIPETQTLAFIISIAGQLYVAIIIAILIGKYLMHSGQKNES